MKRSSEDINDKEEKKYRSSSNDVNLFDYQYSEPQLSYNNNNSPTHLLGNPANLYSFVPPQFQSLQSTQYNPFAFLNPIQLAASAVEILKGESRVIYIGNIPEGTITSDIINVVRGGMIDSIKLMPEKHCCFLRFVDTHGAAIFYNSVAYNNGIEVNGTPLKVGWGKTSASIPTNLASAISHGATRTIYLGNLPDGVEKERLAQDFAIYGPVECVSVSPEKRCAFVSFDNICDAAKAVTAIRSAPSWAAFKVNFSKDKCDRDINGLKSPNNAFELSEITNPALANLVSVANNQQRMVYGIDPATGASNCANLRVIYMGNLDDDVTVEDICNSIRAGGPLFAIKLVPEKKCAFLTFVDSYSAQVLYQVAQTPTGGIVIKNKRIKVGWGKPSILPKAAGEALRFGASRSICIQGLNEFSDLNADFAQFGEVEQIHIVSDKSTVFVNFCCVMDAVKALNAVNDGILKEKYKDFSCIFGKDRVSCEPRLTVSKRVEKYQKVPHFNSSKKRKINMSLKSNPVIVEQKEEIEYLDEAPEENNSDSESHALQYE